MPPKKRSSDVDSNGSSKKPKNDQDDSDESDTQEETIVTEDGPGAGDNTDAVSYVSPTDNRLIQSESIKTWIN